MKQRLVHSFVQNYQTKTQDHDTEGKINHQTDKQQQQQQLQDLNSKTGLLQSGFSFTCYQSEIQNQENRQFYKAKMLFLISRLYFLFFRFNLIKTDN